MRFAKRSIFPASIAALAAALVLLQPGHETVAAQEPTALPTDLALVPADAAGFVHIRGADLWKSEIFSGFRTTFAKAGPKALAALESQFVPKPSTFERFSGFLLYSENKRDAELYGILKFSAPFEIAE